MSDRRSSLSLALIAATLFALCALDSQFAHANDYFVNPTGAGGAFTSIQAAVNTVPAGTAGNRTNIFIAPGIYNETTGASANLNISKPFLTFIGQGASPHDVVIQNNVAGLTGATRLQSSANDFLATNLTFRNTRGDNNGQAVALRNSADRSAFKNVRFVGFQDTLLAENRIRQYYLESYITGDTDFIFGNATAVFDKCVINSSDGSFVTAPETDVETAVGLVFLNSTLTRNGPPGSASQFCISRPAVALGAGKNPECDVHQYEDGRSHSHAAGWDPWNLDANPNSNPDATTRFAEFGSANLSGVPFSVGGNGLPIGRVAWADPMTADQAAAYTLANIFGGPAFWNNNRALQPEFVGGDDGYTNQASFAAWNPIESLAALPPIPEPLSLALLIVGITILPSVRRR